MDRRFSVRQADAGAGEDLIAVRERPLLCCAVRLTPSALDLLKLMALVRMRKPKGTWPRLHPKLNRGLIRLRSELPSNASGTVARAGESIARAGRAGQERSN